MQRLHKNTPLLTPLPQTTTVYRPLVSHLANKMFPSLTPVFGEWNPHAMPSGNTAAASKERLCYVVEVSPIHSTSRWEVTHVSGLLTKGATIYTIPLVELDDNDDQWFQFGFSVAHKVLESHGDYALVLFETVQVGEEVRFPKFWVNTQLLDDSFIPPPA
jgi:hypothetical protein